MTLWYRVSIICGLAPLGLGILIFAIWVATRSEFLATAGIINIYTGLILFSLGLISLTLYFYKARQNSIPGYWKKCITALMILLINFPVAAALLSTALHMLSASTIIIHNKTESLIKDITVSELNHIYTLGSLSSNKMFKQEIHFQTEGSVHYSFFRKEIKQEGVLFGYVSSPIGSAATMVINNNGEVKIDVKIE